MNNADLSILSAIQRRPYPQDMVLTQLAGIVQSLAQTVEAMREQLALIDGKLRRIDSTVETLIEESRPCRCTELVADAACPEHGVVAYLRDLQAGLDAPAVAYDPEDPHRPKAGA